MARNSSRSSADGATHDRALDAVPGLVADDCARARTDRGADRGADSGALLLARARG